MAQSSVANSTDTPDQPRSNAASRTAITARVSAALSMRPSPQP